MKKSIIYILFIAVCTTFFTVSVTGCKAKKGCGLEEKYSARTNRDGSLSTKRGKSQLFSKKHRRRMKKRGN